MLLSGYLLAGTAPAPSACDRGTTYDIRACWSKQDAAADSELENTYAELEQTFRKERIDPAPLMASQAAWIAAREKTCAFEYELYLPGTIAPQLGVECDVRMTRARTQRLAALLAAVQSKGSRPSELPVAATATAELDKIYRLYSTRITAAQRAALAASELAWIQYSNKACALEGGSCLTGLERERTAELEASWIGEPFW